MGSHFLFQGTILTQGSNRGLLHCRRILYQLSHQGIMWVTQNKANPPPKSCHRTMGTERDQSQAGLDSNSTSTTYEQTTTDRSHLSPHFSTSAPCKVKKNHSTHIMLCGWDELIAHKAQSKHLKRKKLLFLMAKQLQGQSLGLEGQLQGLPREGRGWQSCSLVSYTLLCHPALSTVVFPPKALTPLQPPNSWQVLLHW